jgi:hypothetical protein
VRELGMVCVAVTRMGRGDLWLFRSRDEADLSPLVQYGDAIFDSPERLMDQYNRLEFAELMRRCGMGPLADQVHQSLQAATGRDAEQVRSYYASKVWEAAQRAARQAPEDPHEICEQVRRDRIATRGVPAVTKTNDSATQTAETEGTAKRQPPKREPKYAETAVITLLADKDGKKYGPDHNPKKAGSKSAPRFAKYRDGMTVGEYIKATDGVGRADLEYDVQHNFISIEAA